MWTEPDLIIQWWPPEAEISAGKDGWYRFTWAKQDWKLGGKYVVWDPGVKLAFTWRWNFDPGEMLERLVEIDFSRAEVGTCLTIRQGPYLESEADQTDRQGHIEGWLHFCMVLAGLRAGDLLPGEDCEPTSSKSGI